MQVLVPQFGYFLWSLIIFLIFFFLLKKFAWKPILKGLKDREDSIASSLEAAEKAREEMQNLQAENEKILHEARAERESVLKEAREMKEEIVSKARTEAQEEATRMIEKAREEIQAQKMAAITDIKNQVGQLSLEIAEKVLRKELADKDAQQNYVDGMVAELNLN